MSIYNKGKSSRRLEFHEFNDGLAKLRKLDYQTYERANPKDKQGRRPARSKILAA